MQPAVQSSSRPIDADYWSTKMLTLKRKAKNGKDINAENRLEIK